MAVFILGAGFTKAVFPDAPLNRDLLQTLASLSDASAAYRLIERYETGDIEVALTHLDMDIISKSMTSEERQVLEGIRRGVENELAAFFTQFPITEVVATRSPWIEEFCTNVISEGDVIISLNYDCAIEGLLDWFGKWTPNGGYTAILENPLVDDLLPSPVTILKIHGSANFVSVPDRKNPDSRFVGFQINSSFFPQSGQHKFFGFGAGKGKPYVIAPSYVKIPCVQMTYLMLEALKAAESCPQLVVIGCSLRPEDWFLTLLHTRVLRTPEYQSRRVILADRQAESLKQRLETYWGVNVEQQIVAVEGRLEDNLDQISAAIADGDTTPTN
ncbi:MAG: hypothetical protein GY835_00550 [bacterium]|nr:hypothetical protein [bacterium]